MTKKFFEEVMRIPSVSQHEGMMIEFLMDWGPKHGCKTTKDAKGNVYMEKGSAKHPVGCINHTDTVHDDQKAMVEQKVYKEIVWKGDKVEAVNPLTKKQTGLGMDNQGGCVIALAVIEQVPAIKAMFPVEEETGCQGTHASKYKEFFKDCSFVFSNDSPDRNRATHYSSGTQLYSDKFFKDFIEPVFKKNGVTSFRSEPWTDCRWVRLNVKGEDDKNIEVINAGNGGYDAHRDTEYAQFSDVNAAEKMMVELCEAVGTDKQYTSDISEEPRPSYSYSGYGYGSSYSPPWRSSWNGGNDKFESKGHFVWAFNTPAIKDKYAERMKPRFGETLKLEVVGKQSVKVSGVFLYLRSAYMFAFNYDNGTSYTSWMDFERNERTAAGRFDSDFKADPVENKKEPAGENWRKKQHGQYDDGVVYVRIDSDEDMDVVETRIFDSGVPVDMERETEGLSIAGPLVSIQRAFAIASDALNGTNHRFFPNLDKASQDEFWKSVAFDNDEDEGEFDDDVIDADYTMVDDKPPADSGDEEDDLFSWMRKQLQKKEEPKKDDLLRGHSPDERCSMKLQLPPSQPGFAPLFKSKAGDRVSIAEIGENALEISGKLSDVVAAALEYMNLWLRSDRYRSLADLPPSQIDNFWKELEFKE